MRRRKAILVPKCGKETPKYFRYLLKVNQNIKHQNTLPVRGILVEKSHQNTLASGRERGGIFYFLVQNKVK